MLDEHENLVGVAPLVVVPGNQLDKLVGQRNAGLGIKDGSMAVMDEIGRNHVVLGVAQDAFQLALGSGLHCGADLLVGSGLLQVDGQVNNGNVQGGYTESHAGQLAVQLGDNLANRLGSAGGGRNDVAGSSPSASPVLLGRTVNGLLGAGGGVNSGHQAVNNAELVVDNLGQRSQAVGGAGGVGNDVHVRGVLVLVNTHNEHGSVLGRSGNNNLLRAGLQVGFRLLHGGENAGGLHYVISAALAPGNVDGILLSVELHGLAVDDDCVLGELDVAGVLAVNGVIAEHISAVIRGHEGIVDAHKFNVGVVQTSTENKPADTPKAIDANFNRHNEKTS